jgi:hypothetical protein
VRAHLARPAVTQPFVVAKMGHRHELRAAGRPAHYRPGGQDVVAIFEDGCSYGDLFPHHRLGWIRASWCPGSDVVNHDAAGHSTQARQIFRARRALAYV